MAVLHAVQNYMYEHIHNYFFLAKTDIFAEGLGLRTFFYTPQRVDWNGSYIFAPGSAGSVYRH